MQTAHRRLVAVGTALVALTALLAAIGLRATAASADDRVPLGGGAGLVVDGDTMCTLTTIGNDNRGE
ncbi:MAG: serine protease, partial [Mycobacterium sp.]|nr:serine protease [Mycobacterium sp.]